VIGITGSDTKCDWLIDELGVDAAFNYNDKTWKERFDAEIGALDVFFDNCGGDIANFVYDRLNPLGRVIGCGELSSSLIITLLDYVPRLDRFLWYITSFLCFQLMYLTLYR
jgi:NADPH:quinone reductase-like Zn-dependent oxidoreductase